MLPFGCKKYKKKSERYEREIAEQNKIIKLKDTELVEIKKDFESYKNHMDARLIKKEEIIRKLGERWDSLENNFMKREEELSSRLNEMNNTQRELIHKLKKENSFNTNTIERQRELIEKQNDKIKIHEDGLDRTKREVENLKIDLSLREDVIQNYLVETKTKKEQIENFEKEISNLYKKIEDTQLKLEEKTKSIEHLEFELNVQKAKNRELVTENEDMVSLKEVMETQRVKILNNTKLLANIEQGLKEACYQNTLLKEELEEKKKIITNYENEIHSKENCIKELQLISDNADNNIRAKIALIQKLEFQNQILETDHKNKEKEQSLEKQKMQESIKELKEQILENEEKLKMKDETNRNLEMKIKDLEQIMENKQSSFEKELQNSENQFRNMVHSKNMIIDSLEVSKKRAHENMLETNEKIKRLENEMKRAELNFLQKEKQIDEFKSKIEDVLRGNEVLQYKVDQLEVSKNEELDSIERTIKDQIKLANEAYQKEREINEHRGNEFIKDLERAINKQIEDLEISMRIIDDLQINIDKFVISANRKIDTCTIKMKELKIQNESLQKTIAEGEENFRDIKAEVVRKDNICTELKRQMNHNLKLLQTEILKSEIDPTLSGLNIEYNDESTPTIMERILRQIHTRNVVMNELREEKQTKHDALVRIQEKYQKLSEKIKRVVITVTNAKFAYHELEKENKNLRQSLKRKYELEKNVETRHRDTKTRTLLETYSDYDIHEGKDNNDNNVSNHNQHCPTNPPLHTICEELESIREKSRKQILKLGLHTGLEKNIEHLKAEVQRERKLRKRQEALFSSVFNTLKSASACSQPADTDNGDATLSE